jgi:hypothetical protein
VSEGACRCGDVRFEVAGAPLLTMACHCTGCQRMTAGAFSLSSLYPAERFSVSNGEPVIAGLKGATRHYFCSSCMSWLYTVPEGFDAFVNVRSSMLDNGSAHRPFADMWLSDGFSWAESGAERKFETVPDKAQFGELMADYAGWDAGVKE